MVVPCLIEEEGPCTLVSILSLAKTKPEFCNSKHSSDSLKAFLQKNYSFLAQQSLK